MDFSDPQLDAMIDKQRTIFDETQRSAAVKDVVRYMMNHGPSTVGANPYFFHAVQPKLHGYTRDALHERQKLQVGVAGKLNPQHEPASGRLCCTAERTNRRIPMTIEMRREAEADAGKLELLLSADSHVVEDPELWSNRLPAPLRDSAPSYPPLSVGGAFQAHPGGHDPR